MAENIPVNTDDNEGGEEEKLVPKKGHLTSVIWKWYGFNSTDIQQTSVICKSCRKCIATKSSSTTNLFQHLRQKHLPEWEECVSLRDTDRMCSPSTSKTSDLKKKQLTLAASFSSIFPYDKKGARWKAITDAVTFYIAKDMVPIYTVEKPGFIKLLQTMDPKYQLPSRKHFAQVALPHLYNITKERVSKKLQSIQFYSTTTDLWSSRTLQPYLSLTVHFINKEWTLESVCLQTMYFPEDHTGDVIAQGLKESLASWKLMEDNQVCMTTDSGTNMIRALKLNGWIHLQCFGHRLHNAIENGLKDPRSDRAIAICKKVVSAYSFSWKKRRDMASAQSELGLPSHQLITESPTRWGSRQLMIERVLEQEKAIARILGSEKKSRHLVPSWQDIDVLESVNKAISPLKEFTDALSAESYVTVSYLKPVLHLFNNNLLLPLDEDTELTKQIKKRILEYLNTKYSDPVTDELLDIATLMDPRFKTIYIAEDKVETIKRRVVSELLSLNTSHPDNALQVNQQEHPKQAEVIEPVAKKKTLASYLKKPNQFATQGQAQSEVEKIEMEISSYLLTPYTETDTDPLQWWKMHEVNFPRLSHLAKKYLSIPATSASSERVFSTGGNIVTCHRACLKPDTVDRLVFLSKNLS